jgi:DNA-binding response OmpR family regulator
MSEMLGRGADDFLTKPFIVAQLLARVQNMLRLKAARDKATGLNHHLVNLNGELEQSLKHKAGDVVEVRNGLVLALARMMEQREGRPPGHVKRMQK